MLSLRNGRKLTLHFMAVPEGTYTSFRGGQENEEIIWQMFQCNIDTGLDLRLGSSITGNGRGRRQCFYYGRRHNHWLYRAGRRRGAACFCDSSCRLCLCGERSHFQRYNPCKCNQRGKLRFFRLYRADKCSIWRAGKPWRRRILWLFCPWVCRPAGRAVCYWGRNL